MLCLVNPCDRTWWVHGCAQECVKDESAKKFHCACKPGFKFAENGKNCISGNLRQRLTINSLLTHYSVQPLLFYTHYSTILFIAQ